MAGEMAGSDSRIPGATKGEDKGKDWHPRNSDNMWHMNSVCTHRGTYNTGGNEGNTRFVRLLVA